MSSRLYAAWDTACLRTRLLNTESFRLATLFSVLFLAFAGILFVAIFWIVQDTQTAALLSTIDADISTIGNGFRDKGVPEAIEIIQQRLGSPDYHGEDLPGGYILLVDHDGRPLAGNLQSIGHSLGVIRIRVPLRGRGAAAVLGKGVELTANTYLFVGRDTATIVATRKTILRAFGWLSGATIILAAWGGIIFSAQFLRRIDGITRTCNAIVAGNFSDRIIVRGNSDELDRLSVAINSMLDRISALLENLQQVSSDVAHDLRTPLTHLRQRLEAARERSVSLDEYSSAVSRAISDTDELLSIFASLLRISQVESGTRMASFARLSLTDVLRRLAEMYRPVAEDQNQLLISDLEEEVHMHGDRELVTQLFNNLIVNALKHSLPGKQIVLTLRKIDGKAVASVADDGPGVAPEDRLRILRRFVRLSASRTTPGNGLGLALVNAITNLHGAELVLSDRSPGLLVTLKFAGN
ncbi:MAG: HAMP domain-containing sensor histidine kinase [Steroidobacteraceae bacterium]